MIKELKFEKPAGDLIYQMLNDKDVLGRNWAMQQLVNNHAALEKSPEKAAAQTALLSALEKDSLSHNRLAALRALRRLAEPEPTPAALQLDAATIRSLQAAVKDKYAPLRAEAVSFLAGTRDAKFAPLYYDALDDRSYSVIESAAAGLAGTKDIKAYYALVKLTGTPAWRDRIAIAGWAGLADLGDKRALDAAIKTAGDRKASAGVRSAAILTIGGTGKGDPRAYPLIADSFKQSLALGDFAGMFSAVEAVIKIADPRGQEIFDQLKERYKNSPNLIRTITEMEAGFKAALTVK